MAGNPYTTAQAPQAMQMIAPDLAAEQMQMQRRQQIADYLRSQALQAPSDTQVIGGWAIKKSPLEGLGKLAQALAAKNSQSNIDDRQLELAKSYQGRLADILGGGNGNGSSDWVNQSPGMSKPSGPMPGQLGSGMTDAANSSIAPPTETGGAPAVSTGGLPTVPPMPAPNQPGQPAQGGNNFALSNLLRGQAIESVGGSPAASAYWDSLKTPDAVKTNNYYGLGVPEVSDAMRRENAAKGIMPVREDTTMLRTNADGSTTPFFTAPSLKLGANVTWQNGQPVATPIAGIADIRSSMAAAEAAGKNRETIAPKEMQVTNPNGTTSANTVDATIHGGVTQADPQGFDMSKTTPAQMAALKQSPGFDPQYLANGQNHFSNPQTEPKGVGAPYGQQQGLEQVAKDNASTYATQKARAAQASGDIALANIMEPLLDQFTSGNGAQNLTNWKSFAASHGITVDKNATDAAQEFKKYSSQLISQQRAAMGGSGTDAAQAMAEAGSANMGIGNDPNRNILQYIRANAKGMSAFATAKGAYLKSTGNNMVNASDFDNQWNQVYDPRILMYKDMKPEQKLRFVDGLQKSGQYDDFEKKLGGYNALIGQYQ